MSVKFMHDYNTPALGSWNEYEGRPQQVTFLSSLRSFSSSLPAPSPLPLLPRYPVEPTEGSASGGRGQGWPGKDPPSKVQRNKTRGREAGLRCFLNCLGVEGVRCV